MAESTRAGGKGARSQKIPNAASATSASKTTTAKYAREYLGVSAGQTSAAAKRPESVSRFKRLKSERISAALW